MTSTANARFAERRAEQLREYRAMLLDPTADPDLLADLATDLGRTDIDDDAEVVHAHANARHCITEADSDATRAEAQRLRAVVDEARERVADLRRQLASADETYARAALDFNVAEQQRSGRRRDAERRAAKLEAEHADLLIGTDDLT